MKKTTLYYQFTKGLNSFDGLPALFIRIYLAPIFIMAGLSKTQLFNDETLSWLSLMADPSIIAWFGNDEWGLGLPFPTLLANIVILVELLGGILLLLGMFTRLFCIPLMFTMIVAATSVHAENGWFAITPTNAQISPARVLDFFGIEQAEKSLENSVEAGKRLEVMKNILEENGNTQWLYEKGSIVVLNNGVEFSITYFIMLLALFFIGGGRYTSIDHLLVIKYAQPRPTFSEL
ncbi:MAG: DoxX family protein [Colwellia sp.]